MLTKGAHPHSMSMLTKGAHPLSKLFLLTLTKEALPRDWTSANISPIHKKGNKHSVSNYQPVSLTCIAVNLLEWIMYDQIYDYLSSQMGNQITFNMVSRRGTLTRRSHWKQLISGQNPLTQLNHPMLLCKAFDTVPHQRLLLKIGIQGDILKVFFPTAYDVSSVMELFLPVI